MIRRTALTVCLMACCGWCLALVVGTEGNQGRAAGTVKPVASVSSLMIGQWEHFNSLSKLMANPAAQDRKKSLVVQAELLAELANVNTYSNEKEDQRLWSAKLRDNALALAREARGSAHDAKMAVLLGNMRQIFADSRNAREDL